MSLSQIRKKLLKWTETLHQKVSHDSEDRRSRSQDSPGPKSRFLAIDLLEERNLLSISVGNATDLMINQPDPAATIRDFLGYETTPLAGTNQMSSGNNVGDFVSTWAQEEPAWMRNADGSLMVDSDGNYIPYINPLTGTPYMESNIYARYFTDEVQKVTIPEELLQSSATGTSIGRFSLQYGGNEVQRLTFTTTNTPYTSYTQPISGTFLISGIKAHGENAPEDRVLFHYNESFGAEYTAKQLQTQLEGLGPYMKGVIVTPLNSREFDIEFANDYWYGKDVPELQITVQSFSSGFLAGAEITTINEPLNISLFEIIGNQTVDVGIPVYVPAANQRHSDSAWQVAATKTAEAITQAFAQYSSSEFYAPINSNVWSADEEQQSYYSAPVVSLFQVPEVRVTVVNTPTPQGTNIKSSTDTSSTYSFEIAFIENSGKINHPEMVMTSAIDANGNQYIDPDSYAIHQTNLYIEDVGDLRPVTTIKETSNAFRVNPDEPDDVWTPGPDTTKQYKPVVAMDDDGDFVIAWETEVNDPVDRPFDQYDIMARRFTTQSVLESGNSNLFKADGKEIQCVTPVGSTFQINNYDNGIQTDPTIACDRYGNFVVGWTSYGQDASYFTGIFTRWYDRDGNAQSMDVLVSVDYTMTCFDPRVAMSDDGHTVVTWNENTAPDNDLYKSVFAPGSTVAADGLSRVLVHGDAIDASIAFDSNNRYMIAYTTPGNALIPVGEPGMIEGRDVYAEMFAIGTTEIPNEDPELPSTFVLSESQIRSSFRVNSYDSGRSYTWHSQQLVPSVGIDADGDIVIGYQGFLPDVDSMHMGHPGSGNVYVSFAYEYPGDYFYDHFVDGKNADLIPFFQQYGYSISGVDTDAAIRDVLVPCWQNGATQEQLGRMNLIMESVLKHMRGASSDIGVARFDADLTDSGGSSVYLVTDSIANATRDGSNTRFFITIPKTPIASGNLEFRVSRYDSIGTNYQDISIAIAVNTNTHSVIVGDTMTNIRDAFDAAWIIASETWQGDDTDYGSAYVQYIDCYDPDYIDGDEEYEGIPNWRTYRYDTAWEIPFEAFPDYSNSRYNSVGWHIFEVTLAGGAHDTQIDISIPPGTTMGVIRWDGDNNDTYAYNCVFAPPTGYSYYYYDDDYYYYGSGSAYETYGNPGTSQMGASVVVSTAGSYTMTWAQETGKFSQTSVGYSGSTVASILSQTTYNASLYPRDVATGIYGTTRDSFIPSNLFYRNFVESTDTAGPTITDYYLPDGSHIKDGDQVTNALKHMVVVFDEQMLSTTNYNHAAASEHGIENLKNWVLLKDGVEVKNAIVNVEFALNASKYLAEQAYMDTVKNGTLANGTGKWEAIITFEEKGVNTSLSGGQYTLICKNSVSDMAGNVLNRDGLNQSGYNTQIVFNVSIMDGYLGFDDDEVDDKNFNSDEHVANENTTPYSGFDEEGNPIEDTPKKVVYTDKDGKTTEVDPQYGDQYFREDRYDINVVDRLEDKYYPVDTDMESSGRTVACDAEGNFATVWISSNEGEEGVYVRKYRTKTIYGLEGISEVEETIDIIRLSNNPTAKQATIAMDADGDIIVAWAEQVIRDEQDANKEAPHYDIFFNYLYEEQDTKLLPNGAESPSGGVLKPKFFIDHNGDGKFNADKDTPDNQIANTERAYDQQHPSVAMSVEGDFVIVWESWQQDGSGWGIFGQRFAPDCSKLGGLNCVQEIQFEGQPSGGTFQLQYSKYDGDTELSWRSDEIDISQNTFSMQQNILNALQNMKAMTAAAEKETMVLSLDVEVTVVSMSRILVEFVGEFGEQTQPQLTVHNMKLTNARPGQTIKTITSIDGNSGEFQVNLTSEFDQRFPSVAMAQDGEFVVTWSGWSRGETSQELYADVYARKFVASSALRLSGSQTQQNYTLNDATPYIISNDDPANHEVPTGMGYDGVVYITVNSPWGSWSGSGTLLASGFHILTAAHVVCDEFGNAVDPEYFTVTFHTADDWSGLGINMQVSQVFAHPTYQGTATFTQTSDIAVLQLVSQAPTSAERYDIYRGRDELGKLMTKVGYGVTADENFMVDDTSGGIKRIGTNNYELLGQSYDPSFNAEVLLHDFDDGTTANDYFGNQFGIRNTGTGFANEVASASGDSGGPGFIDGKIAGVTSGGQYYYDQDGNRYKPPGSVSFDVRVSGYADWIDAIMSGGGNEIRVNDIIEGDQLWSDVAIDSDGSFVVTWTNAPTPGGSATLPPAYSIYARRFDSLGQPLVTETHDWSSEFLVSSVSAANSVDQHQAFSKISMTPMGDFVITWEGLADRYNPGDGVLDFDIFARRYVNNRSLTTINENGVIVGYGLVGTNGAISAEFNVNKTTEGNQRAASVAVNSTGDMFFVWNGYTTRAEPKYDEENDLIFDDMDILYRRVTVPEDISAPFVTDVVAITGDANSGYELTQILDGMTLSKGPNKILVTVSEEFYARYEVESRSILSRDNWILYKDGYILGQGIVSVKFNRVLADPYDPYLQGRNTAYHQGILDYRTGKIEILLELDGDLSVDGAQGLLNGEYLLQFTANAEDLTGNKLDGDYDGRAGGNFQMTFYVGDPTVTEIRDPEAEPWDPTDELSPGYEKQDPTAFLERELSISKPAIAMRDDGSFVVVAVENRMLYDEESEEFVDAGGDDIVVRLFDRNGNPIGTERIANNYTTGRQTDPDVAIDNFGNFVVTWNGVGPTSNTNGLHARVFDAFGNPVSQQFQLTNYDAYQATPKIAINNDGTFMVTWIGRDQTANLSNRTNVVYAQVFSFNGTTLIQSYKGNATKGPVIVGQSNSITGNCTDVDIACDQNGNYVITWTAYDTSNNTMNIFANTAQFNVATGAFTVGSAFRVNTGTTGSQGNSSVAMSSNGDFVIVWQGPNSNTKDTNYTRNEIFARAFTLNGSPIALLGTTSDCRINQYGVSEQVLPDVAFSGDSSRIIFTWSSFNQEVNNFDPNAGYGGSTQNDYGVFARVLERSGGSFVNPNDDDLAGDFQINRTQLGNQTSPAIAMDNDGDFTVVWVGPHVFYSDIPYEDGELPPIYSGFELPTNVYIRSYRPNGIYTGIELLSNATKSSTDASYNGVALSAALTTSRTGLLQFGAAYVRPSGGGYGNSVNLASLSTYEIQGTSAVDVLTIVPGSTADSWVIKLNGKVQNIPSGITEIVFNGNGGSDQVDILGTDAQESVIFDASTKLIAFAGAGLNFKAYDISQISLDAAGGDDSIVINTAKNSDGVVEIGFGELVFSGSGVLLTGNNFERVRAISAGGKDAAVLRDSKDEDILEMSANYAKMYAVGYSHEVSGFATIDAYSEDGKDTVIFYGSTTGNDSLIVNEHGVTLSSQAYWNRAKGFQNVSVHGVANNNTAEIEGSKKDSDSLIVTEKGSQMNYGNGMTVSVEGFQNVTVNAGVGVSKAILNGATRFVGYDDHSIYSTGATSYHLNQFDETVVFATQNQSTQAVLNMSSGVSATIRSLGRSAILNTGGLDLYTLIAFDQVLANKENGGRAGIIESSVDFLFTNGNWED